MSVLSTSKSIFSFTTPLPMSLNNAYKTVVTRDDKVLRPLTVEAQAYKYEIAMLAKSAANEVGWQYAEGMVLGIHLACFFPDKRRRDLSNRFKLIEDSMADVFGFDDSWTTIRFVQATGYFDKHNPRGEVTLVELLL